MVDDRSAPGWQAQLDDVRRAIEHLRIASASDDDVPRASTADWLEALFAEVSSAVELRHRVGQALALYRGGMGSFKDVGTATMAAAVDELSSALHAAR